jgi:two-component system, NtrC family, sensor kinase
MTSPNEELEQMASIGRLSVGIAHEINSPIGSVLSNNSVLRRGLGEIKALLDHWEPASIERVAKLVETCQSLVDVDQIACERIRALIRDMKSFARTDDDGLTMFDLNKEVKDTVRLATCQFGKRIRSELDLGALSDYTGYKQMLNRVLLNILVNSAQAIHGEGLIRVRTREEGGSIRVSISDTGAGMGPETIAKVFQPGFTTKPHGEGTGLGLSMARQIVEEKHGGAIQFESEVGVGTTFHIHLPITRSAS